MPPRLHSPEEPLMDIWNDHTCHPAYHGPCEDLGYEFHVCYGPCCLNYSLQFSISSELCAHRTQFPFYLLERVSSNVVTKRMKKKKKKKRSWLYLRSSHFGLLSKPVRSPKVTKWEWNVLAHWSHLDCWAVSVQNSHGLHWLLNKPCK
jgi:hypothetical protein